MTFPRSYSKVVAELGPELGKYLDFLAVKPLQCSFLALPSGQWFRTGRKRDPPEKGTFRLRGDFQAIEKTGGRTLHAESFNLELYCVVCGYFDVPHAVNIGWVRVWVVGAAEEAPWSRKDTPQASEMEVRVQRTKGESQFFLLAPPPCPLGPFFGKVCPYYSLD